MAYRWTFERRCVLLVMCGMICIAVCGLSYGAANTYDGVYTGKRVPTDGQPNSCDTEEDDVSVTIAGEVLAFTDSEFRNLKVGFHPSEDGDFNIAYDAVSDKYLAVQRRVMGDIIWHLTKEHRKP